MRKHLVSHRTLSFPVVSLLLSFASLGSAAEAPAGSVVEGVVRTSDGMALPGVAVTLDGPAGERRVTTPPSPSWPLPLSPQQRTVPSVSRAHVCAKPAASSATPASPGTVTGAVRRTSVPSPS